MSTAPEFIDVLERQHASESDGVIMDRGTHYDYRAQEWRDGHDHAHLSSYDEHDPLWFCGADLATCQGLAVMAEQG